MSAPADLHRPAVARATRGGAVAAGSRAAAGAGAAILRAGGNAVDAAIAAAAMACVAEPGLASFGGGGFLMSRDADGEVDLFDAFVSVPGLPATEPLADDRSVELRVLFGGTSQVFHVGGGSVAVPGVLDGVVTAHRRLGRLPLAEVLAPSIEAAHRGVPVESAQQYVLRILTPVLGLTDEVRSLYTDDGATYTQPTLRNEAFGRLLMLVASGAVDSATSPVLRDAWKHVIAHSNLTADDLDAYRVLDRSPLRRMLRDAHGDIELLTNPPPAFGGDVLARALTELTQGERSAAAIPAVLRTATEAAKRAAADGADAFTGTTHISVIDRDGGSAAFTLSNGSCSGVMLPGHGLQLNNMLGESDLRGAVGHVVPGQRLRSMMAPTMAVGRDGGFTVLGSGGSERIRTAITFVLFGVLDGASLDEAVAAPRAHLDDDGVLQIEPGMSDALIADTVEHVTRTLGTAPAVQQWTHTDLYFGGVNAVRREPDGSVLAVGDHRRGGAVALESP